MIDFIRFCLPAFTYLTVMAWITCIVSFVVLVLDIVLSFIYEGSPFQNLDKAQGKNYRFPLLKCLIIFVISLSWIITSFIIRLG